MVDLTTLEGADTPGQVAGLRAKARQPDPLAPAVPPAAAVCVDPDPVAVARRELTGELAAQAASSERVQVTLFPVITGQTGLNPIFQGAADFDLELLESRTLDGHTQELIYRPTLH